MSKQHRSRCMAASVLTVTMSHIGHAGKTPYINKALGYRATQTPRL